MPGRNLTQRLFALTTFADGVYFVPLASVTSPELLVTAIAQQLNISPSSHDLLTKVITFVCQQQILLVLDHFEHLVEASELIVALLRQTPRLKILVTSRTRLQLVEEWLLPLDGLAVGTGLLGAAAQLFLRSAQRVRPSFSAAEQADTITAICRQVGGMPLAIELAASWVRMLSCAEIAHQLEQNFEMLTTSLRNMAERHRNIRALFDQSWRLLSPNEQIALMRLSVFRGGWTLDEARAVTDASADILLALVDKLLARSNGSGRYDLHELVRHYASEQLAASGEMETMYLALARTADSHLRGPDASPWFTRLEAEQGNLREALGWAWGHRRYDDVAWLSVALANFWMRQIRWREALGWLEPLLVHIDALPVDLRLVC